MATPFEVNLPLSKDHALQFVVEMDIMRFVPHQQAISSLTYAKTMKIYFHSFLYKICAIKN